MAEVTFGVDNMSELIELLDRLDTMNFSEIEVEVEGISLKVKREPKATKTMDRNPQHMLEEFGGFSPAKEVKAPGLASAGQVKYARD